jgi:drug/metabolite transporter (DMT)-like permease
MEPNHLAALLAIVASITIGVVGQLLLKQGMSRRGAITLTAATIPRVLWSMLREPRVAGGLVLYGGSAILWIFALSRVELSFAYPLLALNVIVIALAGRWLLHERIPARGWGAILLIVLGIVLVTMS